MEANLNLSVQQQPKKEVKSDVETMGTIASASGTNTPSPLFNNVETAGTIASSSSSSTGSSSSNSGGGTNFVC